MYKLSFYVPPFALESVKAALFEAGAGRIGAYDQCCWQSLGLGQFRPMPGSTPAIGETNLLSELDEWKVELVCEDTIVKNVVTALKLAHPYETVAYEVLKLVDEDSISD